eukprot:CAMPEP_0206255834 /NCGR_PEP_ID=MMETSP0047_2-20121206/24451_1 /ASSEMBLY_ACC=CAM_ASM_000192 /TAXON_ID=195065 /ORGANISM="Chroomonas mesostigmatica_cf, Strain CCMP1168" /LENGTH=115 /DNA_ID=CAMNT_0053682245 /DNA_START=67 /DNA_END=414 /DNA_ORIENTATION=+
MDPAAIAEAPGPAGGPETLDRESLSAESSAVGPAFAPDILLVLAALVLLALATVYSDRLIDLILQRRNPGLRERKKAPSDDKKDYRMLLRELTHPNMKALHARSAQGGKNADVAG